MWSVKARGFPELGGRPRLAGSNLFVMATLFTAAMAWLILRGRGSIALAGFLLALIYTGILARWQRGFYALLAYLPFAGVVTLSLSPWGGSPVFNPVLFKDWLFVLPTYLCFLGSVFLGRQSAPRIGNLAGGLLLTLSALVLVQMANPGVPNALVAFIGAKVWLFYLPLYVLTCALIASRRNLVLVLRLLVATAVVPCLVGVGEFFLVQVLGYREAMDVFYGDLAAQVSQGFTSFEVGGGWIRRIPSTFTFVTQYFSFTLAMLAPCYAVWRADPSARWRRFACWMLGLTGVAGFLCGVRAAFVFVPLLLVLIYGLDRGFAGLLRVSVYVGAVLLFAIAIAGIAAIPLFQYISGLAGDYAQDSLYVGLAQTVVNFPLGNGTGTNTGPARYAFDRPELFVAIENYYAKVVYELGIPGLLLVCGLFAFFVWQGMASRRQIADAGLRAVNAALTAFLITIAAYSLKGWFIDLDPINVYFWVFAGILASLPALDALENSSSDATAGGAS